TGFSLHVGFPSGIEARAQYSHRHLRRLWPGYAGGEALVANRPRGVYAAVTPRRGIMAAEGRTRVPTWRRSTREVRVLIVEDERMLADSIAEGLRQDAFAVDTVYDGDAALERLAVNDY